MTLSLNFSRRHSNIFLIASIFFLFVLLCFMGYSFNFPIWDWLETWQPRVIMLLHGQNPYTGFAFVPPWFLLLLTPLAVLPAQISNALIFSITILALAWMGRRLGMKPIYLVLFLLSYPVFIELQHRQFDWLAVAGSFLPPQLGLFLVLSKPQVGIGIAIYWLIESFRKGGLKEIIKVFAPVSVSFLISFVVFGPYMLTGMMQIDAYYNDSLWPFSIPFGLILLIRSALKKNIKLSIASSNLLSPYVSMYSWLAFLLGVAVNRWWFAILCIGSWIFHYIDFKPIF